MGSRKLGNHRERVAIRIGRPPRVIRMVTMDNWLVTGALLLTWPMDSFCPTLNMR